MLIAEVGGILRDLQVDEPTIADVVKMLETSATEVHGGRPQPVAADVFGGSAMGGYLGHHTATAHRHVAEAMEQMVAGLKGYRLNVDDFVDNVTRNDQDSADRLRSIEQASSCVATPTFATNDSCRLPTDPEGAQG